MPYSVLMPVFAGRVLHGGPHTLGFLMAASGLGALCGALYLASRSSVLGLGRIIPLSAAGFGLGLVLFSRSHWLWASLPLMFISGMGMMVQMASSNTVLQTIVDEDKRGRVMSFYTVAFVGTAPFGSLLAGFVASRVGAPDTLIAGGAACILGALVFTRSLPRLRGLVAPIYRRLGILPPIAQGLQSASELTVPPEN
jgi:predicted MFS family arabinose efflux permease